MTTQHIDHAHELRRYARKIAHPAGGVPAVMLAAADEIKRLQSMIYALRAVADEIEAAHARMMTSAEREREACARACEEMRGTVSMFATSKECRAHNNAITCCVQAIRARGDA